MLQIYNSLTKQKETFIPRLEGKICMYVCGITVYDYCHIGHARTFAAFDVITRFFRHSGYDLKFIRNITDIDDKIIHRANENHENFQELTARFIKAMHEDFIKLGFAEPDFEPRATEHIPQIIQMIESLIERGFAYRCENGDVYYDVSQFQDYGRLSGQDLEQLRAGARVEISNDKTDPVDFVLWKSAKPDEPHWPSPWGNGRPGWHIECSAMSTCCLGNHFDIHGGGSDLTFPHHENEIAQSEGATGQTYANTWIHTGMVQVDKEKMSKSLDNFFTIRSVLESYHGEVVRFFLVNSHYRSALNYSQENLERSKNALERLYLALRGLDLSQGDADAVDLQYQTRFHQAMNDDFNTPEAIAVLFDLAREINRLKSEDEKNAIHHACLLKNLGAILGHLQQAPEEYFKQGSDDSGDIEQLVALRDKARAEKNWAESDRLRDVLLEQGITLEDNAAGTLWRKI